MSEDSPTDARADTPDGLDTLDGVDTPDRLDTLDDLFEDDDGDIPYDRLELEKIPRRLWEQPLAPIPLQQRMWTAQQVRDDRLREIATGLAYEMHMAEVDRRDARLDARARALRTAGPLPLPGAGHAVNRSNVQVNLRLRADDHARLTQAATQTGLRPTTLARALVLNGTAQILRDLAT